MRWAFGSSILNVVHLDDYRPAPVNPNVPDPRCREEMHAFDRLPPEARQRIANSAFGAMVAPMMQDIVRGGATRQETERLKARGLYPCDAGTEGVLLERVAIAEEAERARIAKELD